MGGSKVKFPGMSPQERELQGYQMEWLKEQRGLLQEQLRLQNLLSPFLYEQMGLKPTYADGKITGFERIPNELDPLRKDIEKRFLERSQAALSGTLPVDPGLEKELASSRRGLEQSLAQQLGPGYATSTPGQQALAEQQSQAAVLRSQARRGELTLSEQLGMAREGAGQARQAQTMGQLFGGFGIPGQATNAGSGYLQGLSQSLMPYQQNRQMMMQSRMFNAQQPQWFDYLFQLLGQAAGGAGAYGMSKLS